MDLAHLDRLSCPFCGGRFGVYAVDRRGDVLRAGLLRCACDRYPVVAGIPVLRKDMAATLVEVRTALATERLDRAFMALATPSLPERWDAMVSRPAVRRLLRRLHQQRHRPRVRRLGEATAFGKGGTSSTRELLALYTDRAPENFNYLAYRFGHPRHLAGLAAAALTTEVRAAGGLLDLGCGCGHLSFALRQLAPARPLVGVDTLFFGLWLAKHRFAPDGLYLCCRADRPLPFREHSFAAALCVDSFHYFEGKVAAFAELRRVVAPEGAVMLAGMHNSHVARTLQYGDPLDPEGYLRLAGDLPAALVDDRRTLDRYLAGAGLDLSPAGSFTTGRGEAATPHRPPAVEDAPLLTLVATRDAALLRAHAALPSPPPHLAGPPGWNPLYERRVEGGVLRLRRRLPSAAYAADYPEMLRYLPESLDVPPAAEADVAAGRWSAPVRALGDRFAVLALPPGLAAEGVSQAAGAG
jgi:SAM-dependent methyltransferase